MAGSDNSFERQMLDFYGLTNVLVRLEKHIDDTDSELTALALGAICTDISAKHFDTSHESIASEKNRLQTELYAQLEKDREGQDAA